jgi:septal ring factor EnvC (AmiA/AmiB activator)
MIGLDQIKLLESKVNKAVEQIRLLKEENKTLKRTVEKSQARMQELDGLVARFKSDQDEIEQGILRALKNLDKLEDEVGSKSRKDSGTHAPAAAPAVAPAAAPAAPPPAPARASAQHKAAPVASSEPDPAVEPVVDVADEEEPSGSTGEQLDIF